MLTLEGFLSKYEGSLFLIRDSMGNVVFPKDAQRLNIFNDVLSCKCDENGYHIFNNIYFEYNSQLIVENDELYTIDSLVNVTKFEKNSIIDLTDEVTNLAGRRLTYERFNVFILEAIKLGRPFACVMGDADYFKNINDTYGHACGDLMLHSLGMILYNNTRQKKYRGNHVLRGNDIVGRYGGEEFLLVLNNVSLISSYNIVNKIRREIASSIITYVDKSENEVHVKSCTMSFGIRHVDKDELLVYKNNEQPIDEIRNAIINDADKACYKSKENGRNTISMHGIENNQNLIDPKNQKILMKQVIEKMKF